MNERPNQVIFDADGVLLDSSRISMDLAGAILDLFGGDGPISNRAEQLRRFGPEAQTALVGSEDVSTLNELHRLLMRHHARRIPPFAPVLEVAARVRTPRRIITATFAAGVRMALGANAALFAEIEGRESGRKPDLLRRAVTAMPAIYVTDTVRDLGICHELAIPTIAVTWGYDDAERLAALNPDYLVETPDGLGQLFAQLGLAGTPEPAADRCAVAETHQYPMPCGS